MFWIARTGAQWRNLPEEFGKWDSVYWRFRDWGAAGVFELIFNALSEEPDMEMAMIDGSIVKVHGHGQGSNGNSKSGDRQVGGRLDDEDAGADGCSGNLVRFVLLPGHCFDSVGLAPLIDGSSLDAMLADKTFDSNWIVAEMNARGALICISQHPRRCQPLVIVPEISKCRHLIENFFCKLKEFKRIAMRADKSDTSFRAMIYAVASLSNSR